ncbi:MAG: DUF1800 domain-containing protein [Candidatus Sericytochromatia bacterium]|nr:DUF1800 domain-containing protein [Candidatus Tanganyikabacteria bacterium]
MLLDRAAYGPRPGDAARLDPAAWLADQLSPGAEGPDLAARLAPLVTLTMSPGRLLAAYPPRGEAQRMSGAVERPKPEQIVRELAQAKLLRAVHGEWQLREVMVDFWFNHFNVAAQKGPLKWLVTGYERDVIRPRTLGRFRDLLGAVAHSPAMLVYLDNFQSVAEGRKRGLNENYARELLELHTLGVGGGYTQQDVRETARLLTGWGVARLREEPEFAFLARQHDTGAKTVLGERFPAGGGQAEGERLLDLLAAHPATARHVAEKLVRRFVSDDPPAGLVARAAARFGATGGDIRETLRLILESPEFAASAGQKTKTPWEFVVSALRATGARTDAGLPILDALRRMGQPPYLCQPPTGYPDRPELWTTPGGLLARLSFAHALAAGRLPGTTVDLASAGLPAGDDTLAVVAAFDEAWLGGRLGGATRAVLEGAVRERGGGDAALIAGLVLGSPEFQVR